MKKKKIYSAFLIAGILISFCQCFRDKGKIEEFYPDGTIKSEISVKNGMRNGLTKYYDEKGRLLSTAEYVNDKRQGWVINYNTKNKKITIKAFYKNDLQNGQVIQYYQEGMLFRESNYVNGRVDGIIKTYWPDGKIKAENTFKMGMPAIGLKEYDKAGKLITDVPKIVINRIPNEENAYMINLSDKSDDVEFYLDELEDGKYFNPKSRRLRVDNGIARVYNPKLINNKLVIIARVKTKYANTLILQRYYP